MNWWDNFKTALKDALGLSDDQLSKLDGVKEPDIPAGDVKTTVNPSASTAMLNLESSPAFIAMQKQVNDMKAMMVDARNKQEAAEKMLAESTKKEQDKLVTAFLDEMKKDGRIPAKNEESEKKWRGLLEKDFETAKAIAEGLPKDTAAGEGNTNNSDQKGSRKSSHDFKADSPAGLLEAAASAFANN